MPEKIEIHGHVADVQSGLVVAGVQVQARAGSGRTLRVLGSADTDSDGRFTLVADPETASPSINTPVIRDPSFPPLEPLSPREPAVPLEPFEIHLVVLRDGRELRNPRGTAWDGRSETALLVEAGLESPPAEPVPEPSPSAEPEAVAPASPIALTVAELGEALAATAASIQQELAHYPTANGAFVLDDLDVEIPAGFAVDRLGQLRVRVGADEAPESSGRLRLRVKPLLEPPANRSVTAPQSLDTLDALSPELISRLEAERVYSVGDLLRVSRNAAGRKALDELGVPDVSALRGRAEVVALPTVPNRVGESIVRVGIAEPRDFVAADPALLAEQLTAELGESLDAKAVLAWQQRTRPLVMLTEGATPE